MSLPVALRPFARVEYDAAVAWYEAAQFGLGDDLEAAVEAVFRTISTAPDRYPFADGDVREASVRGFPYCVYYRVRAVRVVVIAIYYQSRDPAGWRGRG
jgi:plasmid stabilization system protein ParE